jgi:hypothetical protein
MMLQSRGNARAFRF